MRRRWCVPVKHKKGGYFLATNKETGELKKFTDYKMLIDWWKHLSIEDSLKWAGWQHIG